MCIIKLSIVKGARKKVDVKFYSTAVEHNNLGTTLGSSILRDALLPDLVGTNNTILYWAGKRLARNFPLAKDEDLPVFFEKANWGYLKRVKSKMNRQVFELSGPIVEIRKKINSKCEFLLEAIFISLIGCLIGVVVGIGISFFGASYVNISLQLRKDIILLAVGFSLLSGIIFGVYPAAKASRLKPVDALRIE